jgi:hypothetical protein
MDPTGPSVSGPPAVARAGDVLVSATPDLATAIARSLRREGVHLVETDSLPAQRLVDVLWAAHRAGRIIGQKVSVELSSPESWVSRVTVKVTCQPQVVVGRVAQGR